MISSVLIWSYPRSSVLIYVHLWIRPSAQKNRGVRSIPGCGAGMDAPAALHGGATGGDERRHIASALHRGSEGAPAISVNPLPTQLIAGAAFHQTFLSWLNLPSSLSASARK